MVKDIPLINSNLVALIDDEDYERVNQYKWRICRWNRVLYAFKRNHNIFVSMHRFILNPKPDEEVDHINNNGLDNRRCNLRIATRSQSSMNARKRLNSLSKYKGAYWRKDRKKWDSSIYFNGKRIWLGEFFNEIDAAHAYDNAARKYFGEYAKLNFPEEEKK